MVFLVRFCFIFYAFVVTVEYVCGQKKSILPVKSKLDFVRYKILIN